MALDLAHRQPAGVEADDLALILSLSKDEPIEARHPLGTSCGSKVPGQLGNERPLQQRLLQLPEQSGIAGQVLGARNPSQQFVQ
jgi:hypothetical protein